MVLQKWLKRALCAGAMAMMAGPAGAQPASSAPAARLATAGVPGHTRVATVNGEDITYAQLEPVLKQTGPLPQLPEAERREVQREALSMLIDDLLLQQFLRQNAPPANSAEIDRKMDEMVAGLKAKGKTLDEFSRESGQTVEQMRASLGCLMQWSAYAERRVSDADVQKYYQEYKDFFDRVLVRASHIVIRLGPNSGPSDRIAARNKLLEIRRHIVAGKLDFAAAAKEHSQCPTALKGGDIGTFPRKYVVEEKFARVAFALAPGQISDVVETEFGLHLIKVTERKPGQPSDFARIKDEVREHCMEDMRQSLMTQVRKAARIELHLP